jgi:hypothetical protein
MRGLAYFAAGCLDRAKRHPDRAERRRSHAVLDLLTPIVKAWCTERCVQVASLGVQVHGGMGFIEETGAAQYLRDARITTIYEGTTGIQANDLVGRKVAFEKGATAFALIGEMRNTASQLAPLGTDFNRAQQNLASALDGLEAATRWLVDTFARSPKAAAAVAVPYLELFGTVAGGWTMARAAVIARNELEEPESDREFLTAKLATARFYCEHILPTARAFADTVTSGSTSVLEFDEASL